MTIPYATTNELLPRYLATHLEPAGYRLVPYADNLRTGSLSVIILFSPMFLNDRYVSPDAVWQKYFKDRAPQLRIVSAGFAGPVHDNFLELSDIPEDFGRFLSQAKRVSEDLNPVNTGGLNMAAKLRRLFEGHGGESVHAVLTDLRSATVTISTLLKQPAGQETVQAEYFGNTADFLLRWRQFSERWNRYFPFLGCLPFITSFRKIHQYINTIDQIFNSDHVDVNLYMKSNAPELIGEINLLFEQIESYA